MFYRFSPSQSSASVISRVGARSHGYGPVLKKELPRKGPENTQKKGRDVRPRPDGCFLGGARPFRALLRTLGSFLLLPSDFPGRLPVLLLRVLLLSGSLDSLPLLLLQVREYRVEEVDIGAHRLLSQRPESFLLPLGLLNKDLRHSAGCFRLLPERAIPGVNKALGELYVALLDLDGGVGDSLIGFLDRIGHLFGGLVCVICSAPAHYVTLSLPYDEFNLLARSGSGVKRWKKGL
jgi:hypothetical protein